MREKLLREKEVTIKKCIEFARATELSKIQAEEMKQRNEIEILPADDEQVNQIFLVTAEKLSTIVTQTKITNQNQKRNIIDVVNRSYRITLNRVKPLDVNVIIAVKKDIYQYVAEKNPNRTTVTDRSLKEKVLIILFKVTVIQRSHLQYHVKQPMVFIIKTTQG